MQYLMIFDSTAHAIRAENELLADDNTIKIRTIPNEISAGCGLSIYFQDLDKVKQSINKRNIIYNAIYQVVNDTFNVVNNV